MDPKEKLLDAIADAYAEIDDKVEEHSAEFRKRLNVLLNEEGERVPEIWEAGGCPLNVTLDGLSRVPLNQRGEQWNILTGRLFSCALDQTFIEIYSIPFLNIAPGQAKTVRDAGRQLGDSGVRSVAKTGPGKPRFEMMRNSRRERRMIDGEANANQ